MSERRTDRPSGETRPMRLPGKTSGSQTPQNTPGRPPVPVNVVPIQPPPPRDKK